MSNPVLDRYGIIHMRLTMGDPGVVQVVGFASGCWKVRWGVEDVTLDCAPDSARHLADVFEREGFYPELRRLIRIAADVCDQKAGVAS